jgi:hypothetical protein
MAVLLGSQTAARLNTFAILPIDRIRQRGRTVALEIYALVGDEKVAETPSFREFRAAHLQLPPPQWREMT